MFGLGVRRRKRDRDVLGIGTREGGKLGIRLKKSRHEDKSMTRCGELDPLNSYSKSIFQFLSRVHGSHHSNGESNARSVL